MKVLLLALRCIVGLGILLVPDAAVAQPPNKLYRIGMPMLASTGLPARLRPALRELGYVEGRNLILEERCCAADDIDESQG